jgi:hypothetical protein
VPHNFTFLEIRQKQGESDHDFHRRKTAEFITSNAKYDTLHLHQDEFERLPDKQYT